MAFLDRARVTARKRRTRNAPPRAAETRMMS
jgi:hypothetical protein